MSIAATEVNISTFYEHCLRKGAFIMRQNIWIYTYKMVKKSKLQDSHNMTHA